MRSIEAAAIVHSTSEAVQQMRGVDWGLLKQC